MVKIESKNCKLAFFQLNLKMHKIAHVISSNRYFKGFFFAALHYHWLIGQLDHWINWIIGSIGSLDQLEHWINWIIGSIGSLDRWIIGSLDQLDHWITGSLDHWMIGSLDHWIIGSLDDWIIVSLYHWIIA